MTEKEQRFKGGLSRSPIRNFYREGVFFKKLSIFGDLYENRITQNLKISSSSKTLPKAIHLIFQHFFQKSIRNNFYSKLCSKTPERDS